MDTKRIQNEINILLNKLGKGYQATLILRSTDNIKMSKIVTTEDKIGSLIETISYLSKKQRETKESLN